MSVKKNHILPKRFFENKTNIFLKFVWKGKGSRIAKTILKKKNIMGGISLSNFKTYYLATIIKNSYNTIKVDSIGRDTDTQVSGTEENQKQIHTNLPNWFLAKVKSNSMEER